MADAIGLRARLAPSHRWHIQVNRLKYPYAQIQASTGTPSTSGHQLSRSTPKSPQISRKASEEITNAETAVRTGSRPEGIARPLVRGFSASMRWSRIRLESMAAVRANTIATTTRPSGSARGSRTACSPTCAAMNAASTAKGSAKIEWAILMSSAMTRNTDTMGILHLREFGHGGGMVAVTIRWSTASDPLPHDSTKHRRRPIVNRPVDRYRKHRAHPQPRMSWMIDELEFAPAVAPLQISEHRGEVARSRPNDVPRGLEQLHRPPAEAERLEDRRILLAQRSSTSIRGSSRSRSSPLGQPKIAVSGLITALAAIFNHWYSSMDGVQRARNPAAISRSRSADTSLHAGVGPPVSSPIQRGSQAVWTTDCDDGRNAAKPLFTTISERTFSGRITRPPKSHPVLEEIDASPVGESGAPRRQSLLDRVGLGGHHQSFQRAGPPDSTGSGMPIRPRGPEDVGRSTPTDRVGRCDQRAGPLLRFDEVDERGPFRPLRRRRSANRNYACGCFMTENRSTLGRREAEAACRSGFPATLCGS